MKSLGFFLFVTSLLLSLVGVFILFESSTYNSLLQIGDKYYFVKFQALWVVVGSIVALVVSRIPYKKYYDLALPILLVTIVLLVAVFFPGIGVKLKGAHRWVNGGFFLIQPSELLKISLTIYLAAWLSVKEKGRIFAFLLLLGLNIFLVIVEPDMGTAFIIAASATLVYFLSGVSVKEMGLIGLLLVVGIFTLIKIEPYRLARLTAFQSFDKTDLLSTSYHVKQVLIALGSGGATGVGLGQSIQKYAYLPESTTDSIFAIFSEEAGFVGSTILIGMFLTLFLIGFLISAKTTDMFGKLLSGGIIIFIAIQTFVNLASQVVLVPLTGVPLPFISYGGSSTIINFIAIGILLNIAQKAKISKR